MQTTILKKLISTLESNSNFVVEGLINKNKVAELARKYDTTLLNLLQKDRELKNHFFSITEGGLVFKKDVLLQFISNKEFLPDSYTKYKIKIGLGTNDGSFLSESGQIVLNWPYKDTLLEGGQEKEDNKRSEIFFNEVLAPDQITRILDDKVFTNWKRIDANGESSLDELRSNDNLILKGNNLVIMHSLENKFAGKVKLIYIDPPYNTGSDSFGYNDRFNHSTWLTFMRNRIEIAKQLLSDDGLIVVHCDNNEDAYLRVLMDEKDMLGRDNLLSTIAVKVSTESGVKVNANKPVRVKETLLIYTKSNNYNYIRQYVEEEKYDKNYSTYVYNPKDNPEKWVMKNIKVAFKEKYPHKTITDSDLYAFQVSDKNNIFSVRAISSSLMKEFDESGKEFLIKISEKKRTILYKRGEVVFFSKRVHEIDGKECGTKHLSDIWTDIKWDGIAGEGGVILKSGKKPERLLKRIIAMSTNPGDIVLDYHLGCGTTAAVAHKMGRQYIGIEQLYYGENDSTVRLKNVISGDQTGISKSVNWSGGGSFVYANIMNNANTFRQTVLRTNNDKELLDLLTEALSSSFLSYRIDPKKVDKIQFKKLSTTEKKRLLIELVDNNTLYVNYEDINDGTYKVSDDDKKFNNELYKNRG